jgi:hypothetical protein
MIILLYFHQPCPTVGNQVKRVIYSTKLEDSNLVPMSKIGWFEKVTQMIDYDRFSLVEPKVHVGTVRVILRSSGADNFPSSFLGLTSLMFGV